MLCNMKSITLYDLEEEGLGNHKTEKGGKLLFAIS